MSPLSCPEVQDRLDLYAADECDPAEAEKIGRHLADCPRCTAAHDEARQLVGLLDLRLQEPERLRRLEARLAAEEAPRRRALRFPAGLRRAAALAAMLLLTVGLAGWVAPGLRPVEGDGGLAVALREVPRDKQEALAAPADTRVGPTATKEPAGERLPATADLSLEFRNKSDQPIAVWVAGPLTDLQLDVSGPGVMRKDVEAAPLPPRCVVLQPGDSHVIRIDRLTDGDHAWYLTKPGDYTVTARLHTLVSTWRDGSHPRVVRSKPVTIHVDAP